WGGKSDGVWTARCGNHSFASDDMVRDHVHGLRDGIICQVGARLGPGKFRNLQHDEARRYETHDPGSGNPCSRDEFAAGTTATAAAGACTSAAKEVTSF